MRRAPVDAIGAGGNGSPASPMRLWTLHPSFLDARGLVALWREGLLAQAVLRGRTRGYRNHPQLARFRALPRPLAGIATYLRAVREEAVRRGYRFDVRKIGRGALRARIPVARGQIAREWRHLKEKLAARDPARLRAIGRRTPEVHPLFRPVPGGIAPWERLPAASRRVR